MLGAYAPLCDGRDVNGRVPHTLPAEASLYKWYQAVMGTTQTARGERIRIARQQTAGTLPSVTCISAPEYAVLRAQQLQGQAYVEPSAALLDFQVDLCAMCGGALVQVGCGCAVVERDGDTLIIKELLGADTASAAQALLAAFDAQAAQVCPAKARRRTADGSVSSVFPRYSGYILGALSGLSKNFMDR